VNIVLKKLLNVLAYNKTTPPMPYKLPPRNRGTSNYERFVGGIKNQYQVRIEAAGKRTIYEYPPLPFRYMISAVEMDTDILDSIGFLTDASVGQGYYITADNQEIVDKVMDFMKEIKASEMTLNQGFETLTYGTSLWTLDPVKKNFFDWFQLGAIYCAYQPDGNNPEHYRTQLGNIPADEAVHFSWRRSNSRTFGLGLAYPLLIEAPYQTYKNDGTPELLVRPPITEMKKQMQHDALIRHHKSIGKSIISIPDVENQDKVTDLSDKLNTPYTGVDHLVNYKVETHELGANRRIMEADVKTMLDEEYIKASGNPETKLITAQGYTEASALAAIKAASIRLASFERYMSVMWQENMLKMWYEHDPYFDANNVPIPWKYAKIEVKWGSEAVGEVDFNSFVSLIQLTQSSGFRVLTEKEIRQNLRKFDLELDADETIGILSTPPQPSNESEAQKHQLELWKKQITLTEKTSKLLDMKLHAKK